MIIPHLIAFASLATASLLPHAGTAAELAGVSVIPHRIETAMRYRKPHDPGLAARVQLFVKGRCSRTNLVLHVANDSEKPLILTAVRLWLPKDGKSCRPFRSSRYPPVAGCPTAREAKWSPVQRAAMALSSLCCRLRPWQVLPCLLLTFLFGPVGWLLYMAVRPLPSRNRMRN